MTTPTEQPSMVSGQTPAEVDERAAQPPLYASVESWVTGYFTPMFLHRIPGSPRLRWCARWWDHAEAIARLTVLWNSWEAARWQPSAKPGWWLDLDHHLPILTSLDGPFRNCRQPEGHRPGKHEPETTPDLQSPPAGWWD